MRAGNAKQEINLAWPYNNFFVINNSRLFFYLTLSVKKKQNRIMSTKKLTVKRDTLKQFTQKCQRRYLTWKESKSIRSSEFDSNKHMYALYIYKNNSACIWLHT